MTGTVGGQLVSVAGLPVLSRLYAPEQFGSYSFIVALAAVASAVATLRLDAAAMLPSSVREVRALVWLALTSATFVSLIFLLGLHLLAGAQMFGLHEHGFVAVWVGTFTFSGALFGLFSQLSLRKRNYGLVARRTFLRASVSTGSQITLGLVSARFSGGLLIGGLAGQLVGTASMIRNTREFSRLPRRDELLPVLRRYWRFPAVFAPSALLNSLGLQAPLIFITMYFGVAAGGQLGIAERIIAIPVTLIGTAVGQVIEAEVAKHLREGGTGLLSVYLRFSGLLVVGAACVGVGGTLLGRQLVPWVLGEQWELAGVMVQVIALNAGTRLCVSPLSKFFVVLQQSLAVTCLDVFRTIALATSIGIVVASSSGLIVALWTIYSALTLTYVVTWLCGLWIVRLR